jgi:ArsR family transcriptional regulator, arsenate/arsenite/antimonite-responsive transcriptional repressor
METKNIIIALGALAQETRLAIFRLLVQAGPAGMPVGAIAAELQLANATLSFHLKELTNAGLTTATPNGRSILYAANFSTMRHLIDYLTENCCAGAACGPGLSTASTSIAACAPVSAQPPTNPVIKRSKS